jgi:hypothetical protein
MLYVSLLFVFSYHFHRCFYTEGLLRKENAVPPKAHAVPTKAQRPTPPRNVALSPSVSMLLTFVFTNNACASSLLYLNLTIVL